VTTTLFLIRHMPHIHQGRLHVGRMPEIPLAEGAPERLARLRARMGPERLDAVYASPILRAQQTAAAVAEAAGVQVQTLEGLTEIDAGDWTGKAFADFEDTPERQAWDSARAFNRTPGGENLLEVQSRMMAAVDRIRADHPEGRAAVVSHGDPLKTVLLYLLGLPLDAYDRIEIDPGSVSTAVVGPWGAKVLRLNEPVIQ
jgi:probable phosphoglycerate mutase